MDIAAALARWVHFMAGIMWLGLLYYFNFVHAAAMKAAGTDGSAGALTRHILPRALFWFRWSAVVTWLAGVALLGPRFTDAFLLRNGMAGIGMGAWLGTIMLANVWLVIWPNQKRVLGLVEADESRKAAARRTAFLVSRLNLVLSIPMLFFMAGGWSHRAAFGL